LARHREEKKKRRGIYQGVRKEDPVRGRIRRGEKKEKMSLAKLAKQKKKALLEKLQKGGSRPTEGERSIVVERGRKKRGDQPLYNNGRGLYRFWDSLAKEGKGKTAPPS